MHRTTVYRSRRHDKLSLAAFLILITASLAGLMLWRVQSIQVMSVESASMSPTIRRGDAVVLQTVSNADLKPGDVVSYRSPADQRVIITHRIMSVEKNWNLVITKGDNVDKTDKPVPMSDIIGRVDLRVAYLGFTLSFLRSPAGLAVCVYLPALTIVVLELRRLATHYTKPTYRLVSYAKH
jgi:signal peptidase